MKQLSTLFLLCTFYVLNFAQPHVASRSQLRILNEPQRQLTSFSLIGETMRLERRAELEFKLKSLFKTSAHQTSSLLAADNLQLEIEVQVAQKIDLLLFVADEQLPIKTFHPSLHIGKNRLLLALYDIEEGNYELIIMLKGREISSHQLQIKR